MNNEPLINKIDKFSTFVQLMIDGLKHEWVHIQMSTFGRDIDGICYGCAATNALCELAQKSFTHDIISFTNSRARFLNMDYDVLDKLECAWDSLRSGFVSDALRRLNEIDGLPFQPPSIHDLDGTCYTELPYLSGTLVKKYLITYQAWCNQLKAKGL